MIVMMMVVMVVVVAMMVEEMVVMMESGSGWRWMEVEVAMVIDHPILIQEILFLQFQDCQEQNLLA